ncbi:MAG: hypothetical protein HY817_01735 [Candidatus Abawacabacteria bacterium]|nr:hypothetical protein [Candidatus Abawacabacteria bacterium]
MSKLSAALPLLSVLGCASITSVPVANQPNLVTAAPVATRNVCAQAQSNISRIRAACATTLDQVGREESQPRNHCLGTLEFIASVQERLAAMRAQCRESIRQNPQDTCMIGVSRAEQSIPRMLTVLSSKCATYRQCRIRLAEALATRDQVCR